MSHRRLAFMGYVGIYIACVGYVDIICCLRGLCRHVANLGNVSSTYCMHGLMSVSYVACVGYVDIHPTWAMSHRRIACMGLCRYMLPAWAMSTCCQLGQCLIDVLPAWAYVGIICMRGLCRYVANLGNVSSTYCLHGLMSVYVACVGYVDMLPTWAMSHRRIASMGLCRYM